MVLAPSFEAALTMWLAGIGLKLLAWGRGLSSDQLLGLKPTQPGTMNDAIAAGVIPMAFVIALCITLSYPLLSRIAGRKVALAGSFLLLLSTLTVIGTLISDILLAWVDPRIRLEG